jgi:chromosome partitioning protein
MKQGTAPRTHVIAMTNQKGGCGKTTGTVSLAAAIADEGLNVTVVDTDPQCNATYITKRPARELEYDFGDRFGGRITVIPGHKGIGSVASRLEAQLQAAIANGEYSDLDADDVKNEHRHRLRRSLDSLRGQRNIVLIDTPPDLGFLMTTALIASDWYIIPVFPSGYDLKGLETLIRNVQKVQERYNPNLRLLGVLLSNSDARAKLDNDIHQMLVQKFGKDFVFQTVVNRSVKHREATVYGQTIFEHAPGQPAAEQFRSVAREVFSRLAQAEESGTEELLEVNRG